MIIYYMEVLGAVLLHISTKTTNDMVSYLFNADLGFFYIWP